MQKSPLRALFSLAPTFMIAKVMIAVMLFAATADACTNILVSRGASKDGSVMVCFSVDGAGLSQLRISPATTEVDPDAEHPSITEWKGPNYKVLNHMNEYQVAVGETTTNGRLELANTNETALSYDRLMFLATKRCTTARAAIAEVDRLMQTYGYSSSGETLSISDKNEVWLMEIIGKGKEKGAVWVAARVPDGYISAHANQSRITTFPLDDSDNWLYSEDVISFAEKMGYYDPKAGKPFSFKDTYHPNISKLIQRACAGRIWSMFRRAAPSQNLSSDYYRVVEGAKPYPLFIKPDEKVGVDDVMELIRDHYEGTPWDMTKGVAAGAFGSPYRYRGLTFSIDGKNYAWERPISSQQAACTWIAQSRNWLPDAIGGVYWFTPDDAYTSCFAPFYVGITDVPLAYKSGNYEKVTRDSAWWIFNLVSNYAYERYSRVIGDVQTVQREQEQAFLKMLPIMDETALKLAKVDEKLMRQFITNHGIATGNALFQRWSQLYDDILTKNIDGYVKQEDGGAAGVGYSEDWLRKVIKERPKQFSIGENAGH